MNVARVMMKHINLLQLREPAKFFHYLKLTVGMRCYGSYLRSLPIYALICLSTFSTTPYSTLALRVTFAGSTRMFLRALFRQPVLRDENGESEQAITQVEENIIQSLQEALDEIGFLSINLPSGSTCPAKVAFGQGSNQLVIATEDIPGTGLCMYASAGGGAASAAKEQPEIKWELKNAHDRKGIVSLVGSFATYGSGNGGVLLASSFEGTDIKLWVDETSKCVGTVDTKQLKNIMTTLSPNGRFVAAAVFSADVKVFPEIIPLRLLTRVETTFTAWNRETKSLQFAFDTRPSASSVCNRPYLFYMEEMQPDVSSSRVVSVYKRLSSVDDEKVKNYCWSKGFAPSRVQSIRVVSERVSDKFFSLSRRQCAKILEVRHQVLHIHVGACRSSELITAAE